MLLLLAAVICDCACVLSRLGCLGILGVEDVAATSSADVCGVGALSASDWLDILETPCRRRVGVLLHVTGSATTRGYNRGFQGGRLKILRTNLGRLRSILEVASAAATRRNKSASAHDGCVGQRHPAKNR